MRASPETLRRTRRNSGGLLAPDGVEEAESVTVWQHTESAGAEKLRRWLFLT